MRFGSWVRGAFILVALFALSGCITIINSYRGIQYGEADSSVADTRRLYAASGRVRDASGEPIGELGSVRSSVLSYFEYDVSVPKGSRPGAVSWAGGDVPNPSTDFYVLNRKQLSGHGHMANAALASARGEHKSKRVMVFVPGFNSNEAASIYRTAQVDRDFPSPGTKILYDWPSAGHPQLYLHDQDSIIFARDGLVKLLDDLAGSQFTHISLMGYSAGAPLVMEALRQLRLTGKNRLFGKLEGVIMLSPDIDLDVFKQGMARVGQLPNKMFVFSGSDDAIQKLFAPVWGGKTRLGLIKDYNELSGTDVTFIDPGAAGDNGPSNHLAIVGSPSYIKVVREMSRGDLMQFARDAEAGKVPGSEILTYGKVKRVILPKP